MAFKNRFVIAGLLFILAIASLFIFWSKYRQDTFADEIISEASTAFKSSLNEFLSSVEISIDQLNSNIEKIGTDKFEYNNMNSVISEMILSDRYLKGVILTNDSFSYVIYQDNSTWAASYDENVVDSLVNWQRLNRKLEVLSQWTDTYNFFPGESRVEEIKNLLLDNRYLWKTSSDQLSGQRDILSSIFETTNSDDQKIIVGLIYSTKEMSKYFVSVLKFERPLVSIITSGNNIVTPILTSDTSVVNGYNVLKADIENQVDTWKTNSTDVAHSYSFEKLNQIYWTRIDKINPKIGVSAFAVTMSAGDLAETERRQERVYLYISAFFLLAFLFSVIRLFHGKRNKNSLRYDNEISPFPDDKILMIIKEGESEYVEFKSSLRWDYKEEKVNRILEDVILKSIAAFANAKGGTLIIGVNDDMEILGLESDFSTLKKQNVDYFELHIRKLINNQYGIAFSNENLLMQFPEFEGKIISVVQVQAAGTPVFLKTRNKQGAEVEKFYVRSGNASQEITSLKEINEYIQIRFDK